MTETMMCLLSLWVRLATPIVHLFECRVWAVEGISPKGKTCTKGSA